MLLKPSRVTKTEQEESGPIVAFCLLQLSLQALTLAVHQAPVSLLLTVIVSLLLMAALVVKALVAAWRRRNVERPDYRAVPLLSPAEVRFYRCLVELYGASALICPKVRLVDLVRPRQELERSKFQSAFNRVSAKHIDFVLLRNEDLVVLGVVELDDRSHERRSRMDRDGFVDSALSQAGIRVCRVKAQRQYNLEALSGQLNDAFVVSLPEQAGA